MSMTLIAVVGLSCELTTLDLNSHARDLDLPIAFTQKAILKNHSGYLPVEISGIESGVETFFDEGKEIFEMLPPNEAIDNSQSGVITIRWGGDFKEGATALYIAYILGEKCQAVLFDTQAGEYISTSMAKEGAEIMMTME